MSYRGPVSYQQRWPTNTQSGRDFYGSEQSFRNEQHFEVNHKMNGYNQSTGDYENLARQYGGYHDPSSNKYPQDGYRSNEPAAVPSQRYPETSQMNNPPPRESSWERRSQPTSNPPHQDWRKDSQRVTRGYDGEQYFTRDNYGYENPEWVTSNITQENETYDRRDQYDRNWNSDAQVRDDRNDSLAPPSWHDQRLQDGRYPPRTNSDANHQLPHLTRPQDQPMRSGYQQESDRDQSPRQQNNFLPNSYDQTRRGKDNYIQRDQPREGQHHDNFRAGNYNQHPQSNAKQTWSQHPEVLAKTSGSSAVFGVIARVDTSPTRQSVPSVTQTRPELTSQVSPTRDYPPSFDQHRQNEPAREPLLQSNQQHQYRYALTPISEKTSPPSSISSRGPPQEPGWSAKGPTGVHSQYAPLNDQRKSWHNQPDRGYAESTGPGFEYRSPPQRQDRPPPQGAKLGHRDYEYQESSGYGSESTHHTDRSYNDSQRFPDKGQWFDGRFSSDPQRINNGPRFPPRSSELSPTRGRNNESRDGYQTEDIRSPSNVELRSPSEVPGGFYQKLSQRPHASYGERPQGISDKHLSLQVDSRLKFQEFEQRNVALVYAPDGQRPTELYDSRQRTQDNLRSPSQNSQGFDWGNAPRSHFPYDQRLQEGDNARPSSQALQGYDQQNVDQSCDSYNRDTRDNYDGCSQSPVGLRSPSEVSRGFDQRNLNKPHPPHNLKLQHAREVQSPPQNSQEYERMKPTLSFASYDHEQRESFVSHSRSQINVRFAPQGSQGLEQRNASQTDLSCDFRSQGGNDVRSPSQISQGFDRENTFPPHSAYKLEQKESCGVRSPSQVEVRSSRDSRPQGSNDVRLPSHISQGYDQENTFLPRSANKPEQRDTYGVRSPSQVELRSSRDSRSQGSNVVHLPSQISQGYDRENTFLPHSANKLEQQDTYGVRSPSQVEMQSSSEILQAHGQRNDSRPSVLFRQKLQGRSDARSESQTGFVSSVPQEYNERNVPRSRDSYEQEPQNMHNVPAPSQVERGRSQRSAISPRDSYGPPLSFPARERQLSTTNQHNPQDLSRLSRVGRNGFQGDAKLLQRNSSPVVEETHVQSVRAARSMFEKNSGPKRTFPAPKPTLAPKPKVSNPQAISTRLPGPSDDRWGQQEDQSRFHLKSPQGPKSPIGPQHYSRSEYYQSRVQSSHSQSMDNLDERSLHQPRPSQKPHSQSMQNLDNGSRYQTRESYRQIDQDPQQFQPPESKDGYRGSYSGTSVVDDRPMLVAVKYTQDSGPSIYKGQEPPRRVPEDVPRPQTEVPQQRSQERPQSGGKMPRQGSWERPQPENEVLRHEHKPQMPPTEPHRERSNQSFEVNRSNDLQSYNNRSIAPNSETSFSQRRKQDTGKTPHNLVSGVVTRSYETNSPSTLDSHQQGHDASNDQYDNHRHQSTGFDPRPRSVEETPENPNVVERWPTPPPPITQDLSPQQDRPPENNRGYDDDWRRLGPLPTHADPSPHNRLPNYPSRNQPHHVDPALRLQLPPQHPYSDDSESSEVDVDAPTPPPSNKPTKGPNLVENARGESPYDRNKPVPTGSSHLDPRKRFQNQNVSERPFAVNHSAMYSKVQPPTFQPKSSLKISQPSVKNPPPQKPQRNSTSLSPRFAVSSDKTYPGLGSGPSQTFTKESPLERSQPATRDVNGKLPRRQEIEDDCEIEVTDSDLSATGASIEVHRMESIRALRAKKEREKYSSSSGIYKPAKQRGVYKTEPLPEEEVSNSRKVVGKKPNTKLVFKMPTAAATSNLMPHTSGPAPWSSTRPTSKDMPNQFKRTRDSSSARDSAGNQNRTRSPELAAVKSSRDNNEQQKFSPKSKYAPTDDYTKVVGKSNNINGSTQQDRERSRKHGEERDGIVRSSARSSSAAKMEKYNGNDDEVNGPRYNRDGRGREKVWQHDKNVAVSRDRNMGNAGATSRDKNTSSENKDRPGHRSRGPEERHRREREDDKRFEERRRRNDDSLFPHHRSHSPDRHRGDERDNRHHHQRSPQHQRPNQPRESNGPKSAKEPDWVEQFRRGREARGQNQPHKSRTKDPRRVEVTVDGGRRELDMDAFEREVKKATSYNSDFEQPEPRRQMIPSKLLSSRPPSGGKKQPPPGDWMNALKEKNKNAVRTRLFK